MDEQEKNHLLQLITKNHIQEAIDELLKLDLNKSTRKEVFAIASKHKGLKKKKRLGLISFEQENITINQIINGLIELIHYPNVQPFSIEEPLIASPDTQSNLRKYITVAAVLIGIMGCLAEVFNFINIFPKKNKQGKLQLTVLVEDLNGKIILENQGELVIDFGNDRRTATIGEKGRTNFGEIPTYFKDSVITIGFDVSGYEIANGENKFKFVGNPIHLVVQKDNSLGQISGRVTNKNGSEFLEDVLVLIGNDTTTMTNHLGIFKISLHQRMQVKDKTTPYNLTFKKEGFSIKTVFYYPKANDFVIGLEP